MYGSYKLMFTDEYVNYLTFRNDGTISFLPAGKEHKINDSGDWSREGRQNGKPSRVIRKLFTPKALKIVKDADFEAFALKYQAKCSEDNFVLSVHAGSEIPSVYCETREEGYGSLNNSCMNGDREYLHFYAQFPVEIIALRNGEGRLSGRALLWTLPDGRKFMDRVYVVKEHYYDMFVEYAQNNKYIYKVHYKSYDYKDYLTDGLKAWHEKLVVRTRECNVTSEYYPYIDTFTYGDDHHLSNSSDIGDYEYTNTGGDRCGDVTLRYCPVRECEYDEDEMVYVDRGRHSGEYCHEDEAISVNGYYYTTDDIGHRIVEINGDYYDVERDSVVEVDGEWALEDDAVWCKVYEEYKMTDDCVELHDGEYALREDCFSVNDEWFYKDDVEEADGYVICGTYYDKSEVVEG